LAFIKYALEVAVELIIGKVCPMVAGYCPEVSSEETPWNRYLECLGSFMWYAASIDIDFEATIGSVPASSRGGAVGTPG
jgi:hypothetical protein